MQVRDTPLAQIFSEIRIARHLRARQRFADDIGLQSGLRGDSAAHAQARQHGVDVVGGGKEVEPYLGRGERVGAFQAHAAAALGSQMHRTDREARKRVRPDAIAVTTEDAPNENVELQVGPIEPRIAARESAGVKPVSGQRPAPRCDVAQPRPDLPRQTGVQIVQSDGLAAAIGAVGVEVIVQVGANLRHLPHHRDAHALQQAARAEA